MYPVLMAADILMFKAHQVPVGRDQIQHIEMARDMAASFNHLYGEHLVLPEAAIEEAVATLPGLDGRKMSKSYDNTIALFAPPQVLRKQIASLVTDSRKPGEPKSTEGSALFQLYQAFASEQETQAMRQAYAEGIAWAQAKEMLFERIDREIAPMRGTYDRLMAQPAQIEEILRAGASKARQLSRPLMTQLRQAVGLRDLGTAAPAAAAAVAKRAAPSIKQYREAGGSFHVKLVDADGATLLQSLGLDSPREAGALAARLRQGDASVLTHPALQPSAPLAAIEQALVSLRIVAETS
jgi:tryptophanyl-tRNA synthetase